VYDDLLKTQRAALPERLFLNAVLPSLLVTFLLQTGAGWGWREEREGGLRVFYVCPGIAVPDVPELPPIFPGPGVYVSPAIVVEMLGARGRTRAAVAEVLPVYSQGFVEYPAALMEARITGRLIVRAVVDTFGRAIPGTLAVLESPRPALNRSAVRAVLETRFYQARLDGVAGEAVVEVPVDFILPD